MCFTYSVFTFCFFLVRFGIQILLAEYKGRLRFFRQETYLCLYADGMLVWSIFCDLLLSGTKFLMIQRYSVSLMYAERVLCLLRSFVGLKTRLHRFVSVCS